ncbi:MAG: hypothetical protein ACK4MV_10685 [Beijerinckiaceae bacterium]
MSHSPALVRKTEPVSAVLGRVGAELLDLKLIAEDIESIVAALLDRESDQEIIKTFLVEVQQLDLLVQRIAGVGSYISDLALQAPREWRVDPCQSASGLQLGDQVSWLVNGIRSEKNSANDIDDLWFTD